MTMKQQTLAMAADQSGYEQYRKPTRRDEFLATMEVGKGQLDTALQQ